MLEPIERPDLVEDVTTRIRHAIFAGALAPGERLVEDDLAAKLGVSRAPIRDALKALERDGLVASAGRRGKVVTSLSSRDAWEVYSLRATLEAMAFRLVMEHPDPGLVPTLKGIVVEMQVQGRSGNHAALSALDVTFHETVCRAAKHERLLRAWSEMSTQIRLLSIEVIDTLHPDLIAVPKRHALLVDAITAGDTAAAELAIRDHIDSVAQRVTRALEEAERQVAWGDGNTEPSLLSLPEQEAPLGELVTQRS